MGLKILVAEDSVAYAVLYQQIFESRGHTVKLTLDGEECISAYTQEATKKQDSQNPFDVVILDHSMPKKTGFDVAKEILESKPNQKIMIITGFDDEITAKLKHSDLGKNIEVIEKPFNSSVLINKIERETAKEKASHVLIS
jgi:two-component system cell cycle response regulator CpdR